jgi:predicted unusual protein kinase regulating ubiquinone biosynthesis (AarF/ABC1/UbiB family)
VSFRRDWRRWLLRGGPLPRDARFHARRAERLARTVAGLGPTFVKLAQVLAARADLIPEPYLGALGSLTDRVPALPFPRIARVLSESYGADWPELFERFDHEPLAAGSLGQVYRARYAGREVVVKVLRPGVGRTVAADLRAARRILDAAQRVWPHPHLRAFRTVVEEFALRIGEEMDFRREAASAEEIGGRFGGRTGVAVPRVAAELTRDRVVVLDFAAGTRIDALGPRVAAGELDAGALVRHLMTAYLRMMMVDGFFHADPHPGNLLVREDGTLVLLDFGMVVRVPRETRRRLLRAALAAIRRDVDGVVSGFESLGMVVPGTDAAVLRELVARLLALAYSSTPGPEAVQVVAAEVMATLYDWPIVLPGELVYFARAAALIEGVGARYIPEFNSVTFATPVVLRMRGRIAAALGERVEPTPEDVAAVIGTVAGTAYRLVATAGRELARALLDPPDRAARPRPAARSA